MTKTINENESDLIEIFDLFNNKTMIEYNVNWIDAEKPEIKIEEVVDKNSIVVHFTKLYDNNGICKLEYFIENKLIHIETGENLTIPRSYIYSDLEFNKDYEINIVATDKAGNQKSIYKTLRVTKNA